MRLHLFISGRVQGVFFRDSTKRKADAVGVVGWVRNLPDGRVECVLEGEKAKVESVAAWCRAGPPTANVTDYAWDEEEEEGLDAFRILPTPRS